MRYVSATFFPTKAVKTEAKPCVNYFYPKCTQVHKPWIILLKKSNFSACTLKPLPKIPLISLTLIWVGLLGHVFCIVQNFLFFMNSFCSSVALVWTFNTRGVYKFITKKVNIAVNLVPFFSDVSILFCHLLKSGAKKSGLFIQNSTKLCCFFGLHMYGGPLQLKLFLKKKINIWVSHFNKIRFI